MSESLWRTAQNVKWRNLTTLLSERKLQSTYIPDSKWSKISIDFNIDLPMPYRNRESVLVVVDKMT